MNELKIACRIEEIPFVSQLVRDNYMRDQSNFSAFSTVFSSAYLEKFDTQSGVVNDLVAPAFYTGEMKLITGRIKGHYEKARVMLNKVEFYADKAGSGLNMKPGDFGFKGLRNKLSLKDDEAIAKGLNDLARNIMVNQAALEAKGLTPEFKAEIESFVKTFSDDSLAQTRKLREREDVVRQNAGQLNTLWAIIVEICEAGKIIGKEKKDKNMIKDYTVTELVKKVRITRKKEEDTSVENKEK